MLHCSHLIYLLCILKCKLLIFLRIKKKVFITLKAYGYFKNISLKSITDLKVILSPAQFKSLVMGFSPISNHYLQCCFLQRSAKMEKITKKTNFIDVPALLASYKEYILIG